MTDPILRITTDASLRCREQLRAELELAHLRAAATEPGTLPDPAVAGAGLACYATSPGPLDVPSLPLAVNAPGRDPHSAAAIEGPHGHRMSLLTRLVWRYRVWRALRLGPRNLES